MNKRLYRSATDKKISGVCGGFAEYLNVDPVVIRLLWVLVSLFSAGIGIIMYIACVLVIPVDDGIIETEFSEKED